MSDEVFREAYLRATGLTNDTPACVTKEMLDRAYEHRRFEIDLYWRRATYFWAFQLVALGALGLTAQSNADLKVVVGALGAVTALAAWLTARGSKFWQENWEAHVDRLESLRGVRLTQVILTKTDPRFSVSRINQHLLLVLTLGWAIYLLQALAAIWFPNVAVPVEWRAFLYLAGAAVAARYVCSARTELTGIQFNFELGWLIFKVRESESSHRIIWRDMIGARQKLET